tara:strand:- start:300 stop:572 length:273 start_codon:yes stop_codon:yes gene_type:complete
MKFSKGEVLPESVLHFVDANGLKIPVTAGADIELDYDWSKGVLNLWNALPLQDGESVLRMDTANFHKSRGLKSVPAISIDCNSLKEQKDG